MSIAELWQKAYLVELERLAKDEKLQPFQRVGMAETVADLTIEKYRAKLERGQFSIAGIL